MALSNEDKKDVQGAMGKAIANKVSKVTRDKAGYKINPKAGEMGRQMAREYDSGLRGGLSEPKSAKSKALSKKSASSKDTGDMRPGMPGSGKFGSKKARGGGYEEYLEA